ncbi:MAG: sulfur oxidation c-type cytochrome SoxX [Sinobacteraceae bacterium]|nr:sulfur oxidation c-type cytochrome SoxX [Nevskiaceae bacterium]
MTARPLLARLLPGMAAAALGAMLLLPAAAMAAGADTPQDTAGSQPDAKAIAAGKALMENRAKGNCMACHAIAGGSQMGNVGPPLKNMKSRFPDPEFLYERIYDETQFNPMTVMPPFGKNKALTKQEIHDIVAYLLTL